MPQFQSDGLMEAVTSFIQQPLVALAISLVIAGGVGAFLVSRLFDAFRK